MQPLQNPPLCSSTENARSLFFATGVAPAYGFLYQASLHFFPALFVIVSCLGYLLVILLTGLTHRGLVAVDRAKERQVAETAEKLLLGEESREVKLQLKKQEKEEMLMERSKAAREQLEGYVFMENLHLKDGRGAKKVIEGDVAEKLLLEDGRGAKEVLEGDVAEKMHLEDDRGAKEVIEGDVAEKLHLEEGRSTEDLLEAYEQDKLLIKEDRTVNEQADKMEKKNLSMKETRGTKDEEPEGERDKVLLEDRIRGNKKQSDEEEMLLEESRGVKDQPDGEAKEHLHIEVIREKLIQDHNGGIIEPFVKKDHFWAGITEPKSF
jgi:hypothetical protein